MAPWLKDGRRTSRLLFENSNAPHFAVYLHEAESSRAGDPPVVLQVSTRASLDSDAPAQHDSPSNATASSQEVLHAGELGYVLRRNKCDMFVEFQHSEPAAASSSRAGCWYGCEDEDDEQESPSMPNAPSASSTSGTIDTAWPCDCEAPPKGNWRSSRLLFGSSCAPRFAVYLHEGGVEAEPPVVLQVCTSASSAPSLAEAGEEVLCANEVAGVVLKRMSADILVEFRAEKKQSFSSTGHACWYGIEEEEEEEEQEDGKDVNEQAASPSPSSPKEAGEEGDQAAPARGEPQANPASAPEEPAKTAPADSAAQDELDIDPSTEGCSVWYLGGAEMDGSPYSSGDAPQKKIRDGEDLVTLSSSKVEWRVSGMSAKLKSYPKGSRMFSPDFSAFGASGLGLVFYPNGNSSAKQGFCSLGLKAPHGAHLRYKLCIGGTERITDLRHNVTESWGFVDMCKVEDELQADDELRLGVEIIDDIDAHETLTSGGMKVEWTIGNMQNKLKHFCKDIALYSDEFSAGGVDRVRLKFYPAGKKEADLGWCSLYLEAPKGSELRCRLSVGKKSMSFDRLEKFGEDSIWGFLTLCKLHDELEQDQEVVRVGLEVLETKRLDRRLSESEDSFLKTLSSERRTFLLGELDRVDALRNNGDGSVPSRFRILQLDLPDQAKAAALSKLDAMQSDLLSGESSKLKKWIDGLLSIPFGTLRKPLVSIDEGRARVQAYLRKARGSLDEAVYGHDEPKQKIVQLLCQWIANPNSMSLVLGIQGPPGNGKTTLCRRGIAEALERPFVQVSLGGATDASVLEGHSYTYVGSAWGRIAGLLMEAQCMNPVIFFDELDKVSDTPRGEEIIGVLTHLTDHSQNKTFMDRYFEGIPMDISRALFIFSFNDESKLNQVLKDRLTVIHTEGFDQTAKLQIAREYLLPELLANVGLKKGDVDIGREELVHLCQRVGVPTGDGGVRGIKQALESVVLHLNELRITQDWDDEEGKADSGEAAKADDGASAGKEPPQKQAKKKKKIPKIELPVTLTNELIDLLVNQSKGRNEGPAMMYV